MHPIKSKQFVKTITNPIRKYYDKNLKTFTAIVFPNKYGGAGHQSGFAAY